MVKSKCDILSLKNIESSLFKSIASSLFKNNENSYVLKSPLENIFKDHLISKCLFGVFKFFQKMNENKSTWGTIAVKLILLSFVFWKNWEYQKVLLKLIDL